MCFLVAFICLWSQVFDRYSGEITASFSGTKATAFIPWFHHRHWIPICFCGWSASWFLAGQYIASAWSMSSMCIFQDEGAAVFDGHKVAMWNVRLKSWKQHLQADGCQKGDACEFCHLCTSDLDSEFQYSTAVPMHLLVECRITRGRCPGQADALQTAGSEDLTEDLASHVVALWTVLIISTRFALKNGLRQVKQSIDKAERIVILSIWRIWVASCSGFWKAVDIYWQYAGHVHVIDSSFCNSEKDSILRIASCYLVIPSRLVRVSCWPPGAPRPILTRALID